MNVNVKVNDLQQFAASIEKLSEDWDERSANALTQALYGRPRTEMMKRVPYSNPKKYANKDGSKSAANKRMHRGNLRNSFKIEHKPGSREVSIGFVASTTVPYVAYQHELPDPLPSGKPVDYSTAGTGNKFVEKPLKKNADLIPERVCKEMEAQIRRMFR